MANRVRFRIDLWDTTKEEIVLEQLYKELEPSAYVSKKWIPQTMGEQVWLIYDFPDEASQQKYTDTIPDRYKHFLVTDDEEIACMDRRVG